MVLYINFLLIFLIFSEPVSKRQKVTSLTPQDIMSASYFMETPRNVFQFHSVPKSHAAMFQRSPTMFPKSPSMFQTSPEVFQRSPVFQEQLYPISCSMYPVHEHPGYTAMYPQYRNNVTCTGCAQGLCQSMR